MGIAGEVIQRFEFAEDGDIDRSAESLFQFVQSGDFVAQQKRAQCIGAEGEGSHNVIVPTSQFLLIGTITNRRPLGYCLSGGANGRIFGIPNHPVFLRNLHQRSQIMTEDRLIVSCYFRGGP